MEKIEMEQKLISEEARLKLINLNLAVENCDLRKELLTQQRDILLVAEFTRLGLEPGLGWSVDVSTGVVSKKMSA